LALLLPNLLWALFPSVDAPENITRPDGWGIITALERVGQIAIFILPLFYAVRVDSRSKIFTLAFMIIFLALYYICWARFFMEGRKFLFLYEKLLFLPIPMAVLPVLYCIAAAVLMDSWVYAAAAIIFAVGHLAESWYAASQVLT